MADERDGLYPNSQTPPLISRLGSQARKWDQIHGTSGLFYDDIQISGINVGHYLNNDHGVLAGLTDNDHTQYVLVSGDKTDLTQQEVHHFHFTQDPQDLQHSGGALHWDFDNDTLAMHAFSDPSVKLQIGQEVYIKVVNKAGFTIGNGSGVRIAGVQGNRPTIALAQAHCSCQARELIGLTTHNIEDNQEGFVTVIGNVDDIDTSMWTVGDDLWLDPNVAGGFITFRPPVESGMSVHIGEVLTAHANQGRILLHGVQTSHVDPNTYNEITTISGIIIGGNAAGANVIPSGSGFASIGTSTLPFDNMNAISGHFPSGVIVTAPNGSGWRMSIDNDGNWVSNGPFVL